MEIFKTLLMGCGALTLLSAVGCAGLVGVGTYAVEQQMEGEMATSSLFDREDGDGATGRSTDTDDPFKEYQPKTYDDDGNQVGGWGDDTQ